MPYEGAEGELESFQYFETSSSGGKSLLKPHKRVFDTKVRLNNGTKMPILGFGTYKLQGIDDIFQIVGFALKAGYRLFDTASNYGNERDLGTSLFAHVPRNELERDDVFIISKLWTKDQCKGKVRKAVRKSMNDLMLEEIDLYLVHWPGACVMDVPDDESLQHRKARQETWEELVRLLDEEKLKAIGVSNFCTRHLEDLLEFSSVKPVINQVEFHPHYRQPQTLFELCEEYNIVLQAYGLFGGGETSILNEPKIREVTQELKKTFYDLSSAQVILRWALQKGYCVLTKATDYTPIHGNGRLDFYLNEDQMELIDSIETRKKYYWDPEDIKF